VPTMSPADVQGTLERICFAPGIHWDAEFLGQVFGCSVAKIGSIPGVLRQCAVSSTGVRLYEFEIPFLSTVQVAHWMGRSRTAVVRLKRRGRLNPRLGPNNSSLFLVREVCELNERTILGNGPIGAVAKRKSMTKSAKQRLQASTTVQNETSSTTLRPAKPVSQTERLRELMIEDVRFFEQLEELPLERAARDQWERFIAVRRAAIGAEAD